jgi:hypothetical protein
VPPCAWPAMTTITLTARYIRYLLASLATIAFGATLP